MLGPGSAAAGDDVKAAVPPRTVPSPVLPRALPAAIPAAIPPAIPPGGFPPQRFNVHREHKTVNGLTEIKVDENGVQVEISHRNGKNVVVTIKQPTDDDETEPAVEKIEAKNAAELEDKHPDASAYYKKYGSGRTGAGNFGFPGQFPGVLPGGQPPRLAPMIPPLPFAGPQFPGFPGGARRFPFPPTFPGVHPADAEHDQRESALAAAREELKKVTDRLRSLADKESLDRAALRKLADQLQAIDERLADSQTDTTDEP